MFVFRELDAPPACAGTRFFFHLLCVKLVARSVSATGGGERLENAIVDARENRCFCVLDGVRCSERDFEWSTKSGIFVYWLIESL